MEAELDEEMRSSLEMLVERNMLAGMSPADARRQAHLEFEGLEQVKEHVREVRVGVTIESFVQDTRYALRMLRRSPGFTVVAALTLALGIGINTAIFSVVYTVLIEPLPFERPEELAIVWSNFEKMGAPRAPGSGFELREIHDRARMFQDFAGIWAGNGTFTGEGDPEQVKVGFVTANFLQVLGARPALGRAFVSEEGGRGRPAVILSHGLWQRRFGRDANIIGRAVRFEGGNFTIVGVMPVDFQLVFPPDANVPADIQAWVPFPYDIYSMPRDLYFIRILGRLKHGVTLQQAQADADAVAHQLRSQFKEFGGENLKLVVSPLHGDAVRNVRPALVALVAGAALVLLIACVNVANLLLTRAGARRKEIALRVSLGSPRRRIIRQLLTESLVLCGVGGALGLLLGWWGVELLMSIKPDSLSRVGSAGLHPPIVAFAALISIGSAILFGLAPALESTKLNIVDTLRAAGRGNTVTPRRLRAFLVVSEITLSFILLIGAVLMIRTFERLGSVDPGFNSTRILTFEIELPGSRYESDVDRSNFIMRWEEKLKALPGVDSVGAISHLPLDDYPNWYSPYTPEGRPDGETKGLLADYRTVTPGYFASIGGRLVAGRDFDKLDQAKGRLVVIVDKLLARTAWPGQNPIGKKIKAEHFVDGGFGDQWSEVVGVVRHIRHHSLSKELRGQIYIPYTQSSRTHMSFVIKTKGDPTALIQAIRRQLGEMDKDLAIAKVRPMRDYVAQASAAASFTAVLATIFAALALLLAMVGIYGVLSYSVSQRTHELGVRMALGAAPRQIVRLVVREGLVLIGIGMALGALGALGLSRYLETLLYGVTPSDPLTYLIVAGAVLAAAVAACWKPAYRASSCNPVEALRYD
jgi:predicted permease